MLQLLGEKKRAKPYRQTHRLALLQGLLHFLTGQCFSLLADT